MISCDFVSGKIRGAEYESEKKGEGQVVTYKDTGIGAVEVWSYS